MAQLEPIDLSQNVSNNLSKIAEAERAKLFPKNSYKDTNQYSDVNPNALADGDEKGRGTGDYLDVYNTNAGTLTDNVERVGDLKFNKFSNTKPYPDF
jgi:hypothetical protein